MSAITLVPALDLTAAHALKQELLEALAGGAPVTIDAGQVQRVGSPGLQLLCAAVTGGVRITNPSAPFVQAATALDLAAALKLDDAHV